MTVWVVICGREWPRQVERVYQTRASAQIYADAMNRAGCSKIDPKANSRDLYWPQEWTVHE